MNIRPVLILTVLLFFSIYPATVYADINWKLFLNTAGSNPIQIATTSDTGEFTILSDEITGGSASADILDALSETSFVLTQPSGGTLDIHLILNVLGNTFMNVNGKKLSLNITIEAFSNGNQVEHLPMTVTIPSGDGLTALLELSSCPRSNIMFAYNNSGSFEKDGIETQSLSRGIIIELSELGIIVGADNSSLGFPASVEYSTWYNIKTLFE
jgi:hypothetical protein